MGRLGHGGEGGKDVYGQPSIVVPQQGESLGGSPHESVHAWSFEFNRSNFTWIISAVFPFPGAVVQVVQQYPLEMALRFRT
jgi:hypothetical protein